MDELKELEAKMALVLSAMEEKARIIRTQAGVRQFKAPLGSIIGDHGRVIGNIHDPIRSVHVTHAPGGGKVTIHTTAPGGRTSEPSQYDNLKAADDHLDAILEQHLNVNHVIHHTGAGDFKLFHSGEVHLKSSDSNRFAKVGTISAGGKFGYIARHKNAGRGSSYASIHDALNSLNSSHYVEPHPKAVARNAKKPKVPGHGFTSAPIESDGTWAGDYAARKTKQRFVHKDGHVVNIEISMTKPQTDTLLGNIGAVVHKAGKNVPPNVEFKVPMAADGFSGRRSNRVAGFVTRGVRTVNINPKMAKGNMHTFGLSSDSHFMPARKDVHEQQYVVAHELGHVVDGHNEHTLGKDPWDRAVRPLGREARYAHSYGGLSNYGRESDHEAYAEAFAQHVLGTGHHPVAAGYANTFGWH
jgi:hypothetical protein